MLFRISLERSDIGEAINAAVRTTLESGTRTPDVADETSNVVSTVEFGREVARVVAEGARV